VRTTTSGRGLVDQTEPAAPAGHRAPPITAAVLVRQVADVIADVPRFLAAPLLRHWHRIWGATEEEIAATMPGDDVLPRAQYRCTRAITISATPDEVWPWLVQVGYGRGGFYADDLLDDFARPSARVIVPELQDIHVGQWLAMVRDPRSGRRSASTDSSRRSGCCGGRRTARSRGACGRYPAEGPGWSPACTPSTSGRVRGSCSRCC
jgi:hypothetical protein